MVNSTIIGDNTVSVIIPTFNRAYCLARTVNSALAQTEVEVEVVIVDDGSTDDTADLVTRLYGKDPRVRFVRKENGGVASARNHGIRLATGAFIAFLDSDDVWYPWKLKLQLACLRALPHVGMLWTDMEGIDPQGAVSHPRYLRKMYGAFRWFPTYEDLFEARTPLREIEPGLNDLVADHKLYAGNIFSQMVLGSLVHTSTVVLRRERLARVGEFDESLRPLGEDYDFHLRTCAEGPVAFADVASIRYQLGMPDRLTRHELPLAVHFLKTLTGVLRDHRARITLKPSMIRTVLAEAHEWVGRVHLQAGDRAAAARHLAASLRYQWRQPRTAASLGLTLLPSGLTGRLRHAYRWFRGAAGLGSAAASYLLGASLDIIGVFTA